MSAAGVLPGVQKVFGAPLHKRTADSVYVRLFFSLAPFVVNGVVVAPVASWIEYDGAKWTAITELQMEAAYTPAASNHNHAGR